MAAPHRHVAETDVADVDRLGSLGDGGPGVSRLPIQQYDRTNRTGLTVVFVALKKDRAFNLPREELTKTCLDQNILFHSAEFRALAGKVPERMPR